MWIGWLECDLLLGDVHSLKQKRSVVRPVVAELQRRFEAAGSDKRAYYVHPGVSPTGLFTRTETPLDRVARQAVSLLSNPPEQAAEALVLAATDRDLDPHPWWGPSQLFQTRGRVGKCSTTAESKDTAKWAELWDVSERLTGFTYPV